MSPLCKKKQQNNKKRENHQPVSILKAIDNMFGSTVRHEEGYNFIFQ